MNTPDHSLDEGPRALDEAPLGRRTPLPERYDPSALFRVPRASYRTGLKPSDGYDLWRCFELSWLRPAGAPAIAMAEIEVPASSPYIVESKSLKLYLGSLAGSPFGSTEAVRTTIERDLSALLEANVTVRVDGPDEWERYAPTAPEGASIDEASVEAEAFSRAPELLRLLEERTAGETLFSHLLRTLCPVTGQPDWATVRIAYSGPRIPHDALLGYLVSYRTTSGFHEHCAETIFTDIVERCSPETLTVECLFTRRGGIDINPVRTMPGAPRPNHPRRTIRQ